MVRTLEDIYDICTEGALEVMPAKVALAQFDLLENAFGSRWGEVDVCRSKLDRFMPENVSAEDNVVMSFGGVLLYQSCHSALFRRTMSLVWSEENDSFRTLRILGAEAEVGSSLTDLRAPLEWAFGRGIETSEITRSRAIAADASWSRKDRQRLRKAFVTLDKLRRLARASERGLLSAEPIVKMPKYAKDGRLELEFPPRFAAFCATRKPSDRTAFLALFLEGVDAGVFDSTSDISRQH